MKSIQISKRDGWFFFGWNGPCFKFHLELGRLSVAWDPQYNSGKKKGKK